MRKYFFVKLAVIVLAASGTVFSQERPRVVATQSSRPVAPVTTVNTAPVTRRPSLSTPVSQPSAQPNLVTKTGSSNMTGLSGAGFKSNYNSAVSSLLIKGIQSRWGIPYRLGSTGPNRYDCSGFIWSVFTDAGFAFPRWSARVYWDEFEPVEGDERFKFGTLVFFNSLGHVGIVADDKGFYHASSSKGITYSPFAGYWEKRIVGYRRVPAALIPVILEQ